MTRRSQEVDGLVEKAILYIERHPHISASGLREAGYHPAVDRVKGNVNSLRKKAGAPTRKKGNLYAEDWERLERRFRKYLNKNPDATEPDIRAAGYGGVFRNRFYGDIELARKICVEGEDVYRANEFKELIGSPQGSFGWHIKRSGIKSIGWGIYPGPEVRAYARSLGIDVPEPEQTESQSVTVENLTQETGDLQIQELPDSESSSHQENQSTEAPSSEVPLTEPPTQALVRIYTTEGAAEILGISPGELPELTLRNSIHDIEGKYFADSIDWLKRKLEQSGGHIESELERAAEIQLPISDVTENVEQMEQDREGNRYLPNQRVVKALTAASILGMTDDQVLDLVKKGELKIVRRGQHGQIYFDRKDVRRLEADKIAEKVGRRVYTAYEIKDSFDGNWSLASSCIQGSGARRYSHGVYDAEDIDNWKQKRESRESASPETVDVITGDQKENTGSGDAIRTYSFRESWRILRVRAGNVHNMAIENDIKIYKDGKFDANGIDWLAEKLARERLEKPEIKSPGRKRGSRRSSEVDESVRLAVLYIEENPDAARNDLIKDGFRKALKRGDINDLRKLAGVPMKKHGRPSAFLGRPSTYLYNWKDLENELRNYLKGNPEATPDDIRAAHYGGVFKHRFGSDLEKAKMEAQSTSQNPDAQITSVETETPVQETATSGPGIIVYAADEIEYDPSKPDAIIGQSQKFRKAMELATRVSSENIDVLLVGESGTGKSLMAKYIHNEGVRAGKPLMVYNCYRSSIGEPYVLIELFGGRNERGTPVKGIVEQADRGDLVLEDLQLLTEFGQSAFEEFLSDRTVTSLAGSRSKKVDVRFLAIADKSLESKVGKGGFRGDLYYKLGRVVVNVPSLRERVDDIRLLAGYFLDKHSKLQGKGKPRLSTAEAAELMIRNWKGNVRELENYMETSVLSGEIVIPQADYSVSDEKHDGDSVPPSDHTVMERKNADLFKDVVRIEDAERILIEKAMNQTGGDKILAAKILGIGKSSIYRRLQKYKTEEQQS